ncbi:MAG: GntR family transcriptional regulator [Chloroflexi bacterium]|nr:GntR family transcriptional regulator [Chloroflexota bacterium]
MNASPHPFVPESIRRDTPIPLHYQLTELLSQEIESGRWVVGERIPTEEELCEQFRLSRTTVRKAMDALVNQGRLNREKGRGTFVAKPKLVEEFVNRPVGFFEDMATRGIAVCNATCDMQVIEPSAPIARELDLRPGETVIKIERLRCIESRPILFVTSYLPYAKCPGVLHEDLANTGLYTILHDKYGLKIVSARRFVEAVAANKYEAEKLKIKRGAPLLLVDSTVFLEDGRPIEYFKARHRGDRTRLIVESFSYDGK